MSDVSLEAKVAFLRSTQAYGGSAIPDALETHMSWVFLVGNTVFKLKKPVRFSYLDYSTLARREEACRAEVRVNKKLARSVYLDVVPLCAGREGLAIGAAGDVVDWLVVMRRLTPEDLLDHAVLGRRVDVAAIDRVANILSCFYRTADRTLVSPTNHRQIWERHLDENLRVLLLPELGLARGTIRTLDRIQRRFLTECAGLLAERVNARQIVDGHGDLRPEHIWIGDPPQIIDRLEFNRSLRQVDPFDEIAFLAIECERFGASWIGARIFRHLQRALHDPVPEALYRFYRCYRATLRARLTIAHLLEPDGRTPEKWPRVARLYLAIAQREGHWLERWLKTRTDRPSCPRGVNDGSFPQ